jgi:hypothetical protein
VSPCRRITAPIAKPRRRTPRGELPPDIDPTQLAFELGVILAGTSIITILHNDNTAIERARRAINERLAS